MRAFLLKTSCRTIIMASLMASISLADDDRKDSHKPATTEELIIALGDDNPHVRDAAQKALIERGLATDEVIPLIRSANRATKDPEVQRRTETIINAIDNPDARKEFLTAIEGLSKAKNLKFDMQITCSDISAVLGVQQDGKECVAILEGHHGRRFEGIYRQNGVSCLEAQNVNELSGLTSPSMVVYQVGSLSTYQEFIPDLSRTLSGQKPPQETLNLSTTQWHLVRKDVITQFLSTVTGETLAKAVAGISCGPREHIEGRECTTYILVFNQNRVRDFLQFYVKKTQISDIRGTIAIDTERHFPRKISIAAKQESTKIPEKPVSTKESPTFSLEWSFDDQKTSEKVEIPEDAKRLFLGDPAVRKILGSE